VSEAPPVYVGVLLIDLETPWVSSLKEKRSLVRPITEKLKVRYPVSVARLAGSDTLTWERIGVAAISSDRIWLEQLLTKVRDVVAAGEVRVADDHLDIEVWDA
jgi:uncharacterized protein YlxP (DUF503 family)